MAEAIQRKLNAEVEKYTQMQKGLWRHAFSNYHVWGYANVLNLGRESNICSANLAILSKYPLSLPQYYHVLSVSI